MQNIPTYEDMLVPKRKLASCTMSLLLCENNQLFFFYQKKMTSYDKKHKQTSQHNPTFQKETTYSDSRISH